MYYWAWLICPQTNRYSHVYLSLMLLISSSIDFLCIKRGHQSSFNLGQFLSAALICNKLSRLCLSHMLFSSVFRTSGLVFISLVFSRLTDSYSWHFHSSHLNGHWTVQVSVGLPSLNVTVGTFIHVWTGYQTFFSNLTRVITLREV